MKISTLMAHAYTHSSARKDAYRHSSRPFGARLAGSALAAAVLLACGMIPQDARGQSQGVDAVPLGDSFIFFVDRLNPDLLKVGSTGKHLEGATVISDPKNPDNRVVRFENGPGAHAYTRFYFADGDNEGMPRDMTVNRDRGDVLSFRMLVDAGNPKDGANTDIVQRYRLSVQFEDYGPQDGNTDAHNNPFRLRWAIPDNMRNGEWHDVALQLPPATWADLEAAKTAKTLPTLEQNWIYAGSWAGFAIGLDLLGPMTAQSANLWTEFEWDNVESVGIQWDWGGSVAEGKPILLDDVFIGPADTDLTGLLPPEDPPPAVDNVSFSVDGNQHVITVTHDDATPDSLIKQYKVYASHNPISDIRAQGVGVVGTISNPTENSGVNTVRAPGELPHRSLGNAIYYAVTGLDNSGLENKDISNSSAALAASFSPSVVQLTDAQASAIKANIAAGRVVGTGFPSGTVPFTLDQTHSVRTVGTGEVTDSDISGSFWMGYSDAQEIYIYAEITDDAVNVSPADRAQGATWQDDTIELLWGNYDVRDAGGSIIGGSPHDDGVRDTGSGSTENRKRGDYPDHHIRISAHGTEAKATVKNISDLPGATLTPTNRLDAGSGAYAPMTGGYRMLIALPVAEFKAPRDRANAFPDDDEIRYSPMSITLNDNDGSRDVQLTWSLKAWAGADNVFKKPVQWQTVAMVGRNVPDAQQAVVTAEKVTNKILRMGGGPLSLNLDAEFAKHGIADWTVHHYQAGVGTAVEDPGSSFVVGSMAWVQLDDRDIMTITPTSPGAFKIGLQPAASEDDEDVEAIQVVIMSDAAPQLRSNVVSSGETYNGKANAYVELVELTVIEKTAAELETYDIFTDPSEVSLTYEYFSTNPDAVTVTLTESKVRLSLTDEAKGGEAADVWIVATDSGGEYARLRIGVNVTSATKPYVVTPLDDIVLRTTNKTATVVRFFGTFADGNGQNLTYAVRTSDPNVVRVGDSAPFILVAPYMRTEENLTNVGPNSQGELKILPREPGSVTFTVEATDTDGQKAEESFRLTVVSATSPITKTQIPDQTLSAEDPPLKIDMADIDLTKAEAQPAFEAPDESPLTYAATSKDPRIVRAGVRGRVLTLTPIWGRKGGETNVTVSATNSNGESWPQTFKVTVTGATKPIINPKAAPILAAGVTLKPGDKALKMDLTNLTDPLNPDEPIGALFIDPNADIDDALPGGFHLQMGIEDVEAPHRYDDLSSTNSVFTSAMHLMLDPVAGVLTIVPTAANHASVTIHATEREQNKISATMKVTVVAITSAEGEELPTEVSLSQNYPNPFNPQTTIGYALPEAGDVNMTVYDILGREVRVLLDGPQAAGQHQLNFDANDLPNGTYVYRLVAGDKTITRTMVLVK